MNLFHKILRLPGMLPRGILWSFSVLGLLILLYLAWGARMKPGGEIFVDGKVYFFDSDCYSRMTRVKKVLEHPWQRIDFHDFENYPEGVRPHTTAPMDLAIAGLSLPFRWLSNQPLDMAGAFIGPILGLLSIAYLWGWSRAMNLRYRWLMLIVVAFSPILVHGYAVGRPDHQCLILLFLTVALTSEWTLWERPTRAWAIANGLAWGFALWTSLFEPLILLAVVLVLRIVFFRRALLNRIWLESFSSLVVVALIGLIFDGIRIPSLPKETLEYFGRWSKNIGEMQPIGLGPTGILRFTGWLLLAAPILLIVEAIRAKSRVAAALAVLVLLTGALTVWEQRWGYFVALLFAISLPWAMRPLKYRWLACLLFLFSLGPMAKEWENIIYPQPDYAAFLADKRKDEVLLRDAATHLISPEKSPILAPWWLSPPIVYWSGQPCIAGSSHQSLPGTVDSARFYLATDPDAAKEILERRGVRYVVAYDTQRTMESSASILGTEADKNAMGAILYSAPHKAPSFLRMVYANEFFKVYEFRP